MNYRVHELGEINTTQETKVYEVFSSDDKRIKCSVVRFAVRTAEQMDEVITVGNIIVEPIR